MQYRVLYRSGPAWEVGANTPQIIPGSHYPGDYSGQVVSVKKLDHRFTPGDLAGGRVAIELDLTESQQDDLRSRRGKLAVVLGLPAIVPVTFDDRWGEVASTLRANLDDPEQAEREVDEEAETFDGRRFAELAILARKMLPAMYVHSGAGLYEVGPGKTYSTIQAAFDQLWTDQGAATFTASQYIRIFAGTYDENVVPNAALKADYTNGYLTFFEGDPDDDRENIKLAPATGTAFFDGSYQMNIRHMWIAVVGASKGYESNTGVVDVEIIDCKITTVTGNAITAALGVLIRDCEISSSGDAYGVYSNHGSIRVEETTFTGPGKASSSKAAVVAGASGTMSVKMLRGVVISGYSVGYRSQTQGSVGVFVTNVTFYDCTYAFVALTATIGPNMITNCIFKGCTYIYDVPSGAWPEETATRRGPSFEQRNNVYHGYTAMGYDGSTTKTYVEWIAFGRVDAAGELDATDPLLADPGAGDFSLQADSPCRHAGYGSGVLYDLDGAAFDPFHPDIGAMSTGIGPNVAFAGQ